MKQALSAADLEALRPDLQCIHDQLYAEWHELLLKINAARYILGLPRLGEPLQRHHSGCKSVSQEVEEWATQHAEFTTRALMQHLAATRSKNCQKAASVALVRLVKERKIESVKWGLYRSLIYAPSLAVDVPGSATH